jgi:hypothetical protein
MKVLIVFENVPETTDLFIVEANEEDLKDLRLSHGNYINSVDNEDIENAISRVNLDSDRLMTIQRKRRLSAVLLMKKWESGMVQL